MLFPPRGNFPSPVGIFPVPWEFFPGLWEFCGNFPCPVGIFPRPRSFGHGQTDRRTDRRTDTTPRLYIVDTLKQAVFICMFQLSRDPAKGFCLNFMHICSLMRKRDCAWSRTRENSPFPEN